MMMITEFALVITALSHTSLITLLSQLSLVLRTISTRWASANITLAPRERAHTGARAGQWRPEPRVAPAHQHRSHVQCSDSGCDTF